MQVQILHESNLDKPQPHGRDMNTAMSFVFLIRHRSQRHAGIQVETAQQPVNHCRWSKKKKETSH